MSISRSEKTLIETFFKLKSFVPNASPVFVYRLNLENNCFIYKELEILSSNTNLSREKALLKQIPNPDENSIFTEDKIWVMNRFSNMHEKIYSLKQPPKGLFKLHLCEFKDFLKALKKFPSLSLGLNDNNNIILIES